MLLSTVAVSPTIYALVTTTGPSLQKALWDSKKDSFGIWQFVTLQQHPCYHWISDQTPKLSLKWCWKLRVPFVVKLQTLVFRGDADNISSIDYTRTSQAFLFSYLLQTEPSFYREPLVLAYLRFLNGAYNCCEYNNSISVSIIWISNSYVQLGFPNHKNAMIILSSKSELFQQSISGLSSYMVCFCVIVQK